MPATVRLCFVCLGNICRSPTAAAVMRHKVASAELADRIAIDSAGTSSWHIGEPPDARAVAEARRREIAMRDTGRRFDVVDFARFDYVLAADHDNVSALRALARDAEDLAKVHLLRSFDAAAGGDLAVPDPYFGGDDGFAHVFDLIDAACEGLLDHLLTGPLSDA
jgi:protein-tyrosine phosphatase